ncbi:10534_t:CDS:2, partial [Paraglomus brasilianum]
AFGVLTRGGNLPQTSQPPSPHRNYSANFLQNLGEIRTAKANVIDGLLTAYNQPTTGNIDA